MASGWALVSTLQIFRVLSDNCCTLLLIPPLSFGISPIRILCWFSQSLWQIQQTVPLVWVDSRSSWYIPAEHHRWAVRPLPPRIREGGGLIRFSTTRSATWTKFFPWFFLVSPGKCWYGTLKQITTASIPTPSNSLFTIILPLDVIWTVHLRKRCYKTKKLYLLHFSFLIAPPSLSMPCCLPHETKHCCWLRTRNANATRQPSRNMNYGLLNKETCLKVSETYTTVMNFLVTQCTFLKWRWSYLPSCYLADWLRHSASWPSGELDKESLLKRICFQRGHHQHSYIYLLNFISYFA